jgi:hypothetical protein
MKTLTRKITVLETGLMIVTLILCAVGTNGCGRKEPPMREEALALKKEIKEKMDQYALPFVEPLSKGDKAAVLEAFRKLSMELTKDCQPLTWGAAVLDKDGVALRALTSAGSHVGLDYSNMKPVAEAIKNRKLAQGKFYRKDGFCAYYVVKPLVRQEALVGLFVLGLSAKELTETRGVSEKEFLAIDFNH